MEKTTRKTNVTSRLYCNFFGHDYHVTKKVTQHVKEYQCSHCKKELTTNSNGNLTELTATFKEINDILEFSDIISNEKLRHVPYAISANNGVPIGSILPFIGTTAPPGWAICNGNPLPSYATELIAMVGANAPNLQGMFLRGTGTSPVNSQAGPALLATQGDDNKIHSHYNSNLTGNTNYAGSHSHSYSGSSDDNGDPGSYIVTSNDEHNGSGTVNNSGNHNHSVSVSGHTSSVGSESRPVNYGVNYIIKL